MTDKYRKPNQACYATDSGWHCSVKHELLVSWRGLKTAIQSDPDYIVDGAEETVEQEDVEQPVITESEDKPEAVEDQKPKRRSKK